MSSTHVTLTVAAPAELLPTNVDANRFELLDRFDLNADHGDFVKSISRNNALYALLNSLLESGAPPLPNYLLEDYVVIAGEELRTAHKVLRHFLQTIEQTPACIIEATREPHVTQGTIDVNGWPHQFEAQFSHTGCKKIEDGWVYWHDEQSVKQLFESVPPGSKPGAHHDGDGDSWEYLIAVLQAHRELLEKAADRGLAVAFQKLS